MQIFVTISWIFNCIIVLTLIENIVPSYLQNYIICTRHPVINLVFFYIFSKGKYWRKASNEEIFGFEFVSYIYQMYSLTIVWVLNNHNRGYLKGCCPNLSYILLARLSCLDVVWEEATSYLASVSVFVRLATALQPGFV